MVMADCPHSKIAVMQLFYELKQKFPTIPDQVVTDFIQQAAYNREECEKKLLREYQRYQQHSYPIDIVDKMTEGKERPKTLSLDNAPEAFRRRGRSYGPPVEEQCKRVMARDANEENGDLCESVKNIEISSNQSDVFVSDLKLRFQNDNCGCERTSLRVKYKKNATGASHSAPTTPSFQKSIASDVRKHRSSLNVDRSTGTPVCDTKRPFTSVNLTLRPPVAERQAPINISTKGSNLTYSSCSYDSKQGYQNQLQISISEEGNTTLSASRTKAGDVDADSCKGSECAASISDTDSSLVPHFEEPLSSASDLRLREQIERKNRLEMELIQDKAKLQRMRQEVRALEEDLSNRKKVPVVSQEVLRLRAEVRALQIACNELTHEMDTAEQPSNPYVPICNDNGNWTCLMCTFKNHPMLPKCEQCDMARVDFNAILPNILRPHTTSPQLPAIHPRV